MDPKPQQIVAEKHRLHILFCDSRTTSKERNEIILSMPRESFDAIIELLCNIVVFPLGPTSHYIKTVKYHKFLRNICSDKFSSKERRILVCKHHKVIKNIIEPYCRDF